MTTNNEYLSSECPLEAIESAIESFKNKELSEWELHLITRRVNTLKAATAEANKRITELQTHINVLRDALEKIVRLPFASIKWRTLSAKALALTPAQSLQAHDNEVIEKCAKVCDKWIGLETVAEVIRGLKEVK